MAASSEESFKVCGLCSQLVDESVEVTAAMRAFLCTFLDLAETRLPAKICLECYQRATDCRNFKDRCDKAIHKLNKSAVYTSMILGGTANEINAASNRTPKQEKKLVEAERKTKILLDGAQVTPVRDASPPAPAKTAAASLAAASPPPPRGRPGRKSQIVPRSLSPEVEVNEPAPRSTRSGKADPLAASAAPAPTPPRGRGGGRPAAAKRGNQPKLDKDKKPENVRVVVTKADRDAAEAVLNKGQNGLAAAAASEPEPVDGGRGAAKRKAAVSPVAASRSPAPRVKITEVPAEPSYPSTSGSPPTKSARKSGSGRVIKETKKSGFVSLDSFTEVTLSDSDESEAPLARKATPKPKPAPAKAKPTPPARKPAPAPASAKKAGPASAKKAAPAPAAAKPEPVTVSEDEDEDMEEIFPAVGPYQCEICQKITDTKQEFVDHIKNFHINVVDEEVLRSLESDLRKNLKKAERAKKAAAAGGGTVANGAMKVPKPSPTKNRPQEELSPAMQRKRAAPIEDRTCKICGTVLSSPLRADHARHQQTYKCQQAAKAKGLTGQPADTLVNAKAIKEEAAADADVASRTCQFCAKVVSRKSDLAGHYKTKACVAKQYEREAKQEMVTSRTPVVLDNAEMDHLPSSTTGDINPKMEPSNSVNPASKGTLLDPFGTASSSSSAGAGNGATTYFDALSTALATAGIDPLQDVNSSYEQSGFIG